MAHKPQSKHSSIKAEDRKEKHNPQPNNRDSLRTFWSKNQKVNKSEIPFFLKAHTQTYARQRPLTGTNDSLRWWCLVCRKRATPSKASKIILCLFINYQYSHFSSTFLVSTLRSSKKVRGIINRCGFLPWDPLSIKQKPDNEGNVSQKGKWANRKLVIHNKIDLRFLVYLGWSIIGQLSRPPGRMHGGTVIAKWFIIKMTGTDHVSACWCCRLAAGALSIW